MVKLNKKKNKKGNNKGGGSKKKEDATNEFHITDIKDCKFRIGDTKAYEWSILHDLCHSMVSR